MGDPRSVLVVDLDGTLIRSDLLLESLFALLRHNPLYLLMLPFWLVGGKARLKEEIARRVTLDPEFLPYREEFLQWLRGEHAAGRRLVLATASNYRLVRPIADYLGIFDSVLASDAAHNLSGRRKREALEGHCGAEGFVYAANAAVDLAVWEGAQGAVIVAAPGGLRARAERVTRVEREFPGEPPRWRDYLRALRVHQWLKNALLFVPLILAHQAGELRLLVDTGLAFLSFGLCASSVYLLNDLLDLEADRAHPTKRNRPFAAGCIPLLHGGLLIPALLIASTGIALLLPLHFLGVLVIYYVTTLAYSFRLKRAALVDVLVLAGLYTLRIIAGAAAVGVQA